MNKKGAKLIFVTLLIVVAGIVGYTLYTKDNCDYQMGKVITSAVIDPAMCTDEKFPVSVEITNLSHYDILETSFYYGVYKNGHSKASKGFAHRSYFITKQDHYTNSCFPIPEIKDVSIDEIKKGYYFRINYYKIEFDQGNNKRLSCP